MGSEILQICFVSCWTDKKEENIPLWKMYSGNTGGIRIALEQEMFKEYLISDLKIESLQSEGSMISKISPQDMINPNFFIIPIQDYENDLFYRHIKYVDDIFPFTRMPFK